MAVNMCAAERRCFTSLVNQAHAYLRMSSVHLHTNCDRNLHILNNGLSKQTTEVSNCFCFPRKFIHSNTLSKNYRNSNYSYYLKQKPVSQQSWCISHANRLSHVVPSRQTCCFSSNKVSENILWSRFNNCQYGRRFYKQNLVSVNSSQVSRSRSVHTSARTGHWNLELSNKKEPPWNVLFFGNDKISVATLEVLVENLKTSGSLVESLEVVTNPHKTVVRSFAEAENLHIQDWPIRLQPYKYDVGVLASFGNLIPDGVIGMFPYGIINMHPSKLPRWRGASPIIHTVLHGDMETAVCITEIRPKHFDIGPIMEQRLMQVPYRCTAGQLTDLLAPIGGEMILESLGDLHKLERYEHEQDPAGIRYAHIIKKNHFGIDWHEQTSEDVDRQYRALGEMDHLKSEWKGAQARFLDILDPCVTNNVPSKFIRGYHGDFYSAEPGTAAIHTQLKCLLIKCKTGAVGFDRIVIRKTMPAMAFFNGYIQGHDPGVFVSLDNDLYKYIREKKVPNVKSVKEASPQKERVLKAQH